MEKTATLNYYIVVFLEQPKEDWQQEDGELSELRACYASNIE